MKKLNTLILFLLMSLTVYSQYSDEVIERKLESAEYYANNGLDTFHIILDKLKPKIDFEKENDLALKYYLTKSIIYLKKFDRENAGNVLEKAKPFYEKSTNVKMRLWYDLSLVNLNSVKIHDEEDKLYEILNSSLEHGFYDLATQVYEFLARVERRRIRMDLANEQIEKGIKLAEKYNLEERIASLKFRKAIFLSGRSEFDEALLLLNEVQDIYNTRGDSLEYVNSLLYMGTLYRKQGKFTEALDIFQKCNTYFEKIDFKYRISSVNKLIADILFNMKKFDESIEKYLISKENVSKERNPFIFGRILAGLGNAYLNVGEYNKAEKLLNETIELKIQIEDKLTLPGAYCWLGDLYFEQGKFDESKKQYDKAIEIIEFTGSNNAKGRPYLGLLKINLYENKLQKALKNGEQALFYARKSSAIVVEHEILGYIADISSKLGNLKQANDYYKQLVSIQDNVMNFEKATELTDMMSKYEIQQNELKILKLENENIGNIRDLERKKSQNRYYLSASIFSMMLLFILLYAVYMNRKARLEKDKLNNELLKTNQKLMDSNQQLEQFAYAASHDLKAPLVSLNSFSGLLKNSVSSKLDKNETEFLNIIIESGKNLSEMIEDVLALARLGTNGLNKEKVDSKKIVLEVLEILECKIKEKDIQIETQNTFPLIFADQLKIKRVFQNILSNAIKFSKEEEQNRFVKITSTENKDNYQFTISDNGIGVRQTNTNLFEPFKHLNS